MMMMMMTYGIDIFRCCKQSCGLPGYRDDSLETVKRNEQQYKIPLEVVSYKQLYGWTMDEIVKEIGTKNNCTFCGVFRRQALDRGATMMQVHCSHTMSLNNVLPLICKRFWIAVHQAFAHGIAVVQQCTVYSNPEVLIAVATSYHKL